MLLNVLIILAVICLMGVAYNVGYMRGTDILAKEVQEDIWEIILEGRKEKGR